MIDRLEASELLPTCGCGDPEAVTELVHWTLAMFAFDVEPPGFASGPEVQAAWEAYLAARGDFHVRALGGYESPLFWSFLWSLEHLGLTEHGTNVRSSWLTPKGRDLLAFLDAHGCDDERWPEAE